MRLFKPSQYKQITPSSPLQKHDALKESSYQSPQDSLAEGQLATPLCVLLFLRTVKAIADSPLKKLLTGQLNYNKPRWIKVTNFHLFSPRKPVSDQGHCLQEGH